MRDELIIKQVNALVSPIPSGWREKAIWRRENREWLREYEAFVLKQMDEDGLNMKTIKPSEGFINDVRTND